MHLGNSYIQKTFFQGVADEKIIYESVLNEHNLSPQKSLPHRNSRMSFVEEMVINACFWIFCEVSKAKRI